jgi:hypothetical protein
VGVLNSVRAVSTLIAVSAFTFAQPGVLADVGPGPMVVVVSTGTPLQNLDIESLRRLFTGETLRDDKGNVLVPLNQAPGSAERMHFDKRVLGMDADAMARFWIDRKIRGQKGAPRSIAPARNLARIVAKFPGTIAYLSSKDVVAGLKVIRIDGKSEGESGYKLAMALRLSP